MVELKIKTYTGKNIEEIKSFLKENRPLSDFSNCEITVKRDYCFFSLGKDIIQYLNNNTSVVIREGVENPFFFNFNKLTSDTLIDSNNTYKIFF